MIDAPVSPARPAIKKGDKVWYVPHLCHHLDVDHRGEMLFVFEHARNYSSPKLSYRQGDRVTNFGMLGRGRWTRNKDGQYQTPGGHTLKLVGPGEPWPAIVREVFSDGTVALDVAHPIGNSLAIGHAAFDSGTFITMHYPSHGQTSNGLAYSNTFVPHTWHLPEDRKAV